MKKCFRPLFGLCLLLLAVPALRSQASYTATNPTQIQAGVSALYLLPDFTSTAVYGVGAYANYDFKRYLGVLAEVNIGSLITPRDIAETSYMGGVRGLVHRGKFAGYGKALVGRATITNQLFKTSSSYNAIAYGAGIEYRLNPRINIRLVDFERQSWRSFQPNALSPTLVTAGVAFVFK